MANYPFGNSNSCGKRTSFARAAQNPLCGFWELAKLDGDSAPHTLGFTFFKCKSIWLLLKTAAAWQQNCHGKYKKLTTGKITLPKHLICISPAIHMTYRRLFISLKTGTTACTNKKRTAIQLLLCLAVLLSAVIYSRFVPAYQDTFSKTSHCLPP